MKKSKPIRYTYRVVRWVRETYEVEIVSDKAPTPEEIKGAIQDPHTVTIERETVQQVKP